VGVRMITITIITAVLLFASALALADKDFGP
jgi:hypothetical protein